ncbi:hypothetical protein [Rhodobaculum claviforme]|uniref:Uncharacterized protein n=1 Tax=Rhodobaculum claviforme TaxID=1549854 RepID=A0A934TG83_9RHOB|nr:hypothetical protein [Rhodobaculum claviforme]MBK5925810.1 hypothetical protein [Rhodobaculum claviforme]
MATQHVIGNLLHELERLQGIDKELDLVQAVNISRTIANAHDAAVAAETGLATPPASEATAALPALAEGVTLRLAAGRPARLTVTELAGWSFDRLALRIDVEAERVALPLTGEDRTLGVPQPTGAIVQMTERVVPFAPPRYIRRLLVERVTTLTVSTDLEPSFVPVLSPPVWSAPYVARLEASVGKLVLRWLPHGPLRATAILDNTPANLLVADGTDRPLHRVSGTLAPGDGAWVPDLRDALDGDGTLTLRLTSQTDAVVRLRMAWRRRRRAEGWRLEGREGPGPDPLELGVWDAAVLLPEAPVGADPAASRTRIKARVRPTGPMRAGLCDPAARAGALPFALAPRRALAQPFRLADTPGPAARRIEGVWLLLAERPAEATELTVALVPFEVENAAAGTSRALAGAPLAQAQAVIGRGEADHARVAGGGLAAWVPFDKPATIDGADLARPHALLLSGWRGPARLLEGPPNVPGLLPSCDTDPGGPPVWRQRSFGAPAKALLFDLGLSAADEAPAQLRLGGTAIALAADHAPLTVELPHGPLTLTTSRALGLSGLTVVTEDPAETGGP